MQRRSRELGAHLHDRLTGLLGHGVTEVRGIGLWAGVDIDPALGSARSICEALLAKGVIAKDTHGSTIRLAPPLVITREELDLAVDALAECLAEARASQPRTPASCLHLTPRPQQTQRAPPSPRTRWRSSGLSACPARVVLRRP